MTILCLCTITLISIIIIIYLLAHYVLNEKQIYILKYTLYVTSIMTASVIVIPLFLIRPRNAFNIRLGALIVDPVLSLFGIKYRIENAEVLDKEGPCVVVANHQSSIDVIGIVKLWPKHIRYCTILAKKRIIMGSTIWFYSMVRWY